MENYPSIPGYTIKSKLGTGGMATVYQGVEEKLKRSEAIKVLKTELQANPEFPQRFMREARIAANLSHPHIITIYHIGQEGTNYYIAMELLTGGSLREKIAKGPISPQEALVLLRQMSLALFYAHQQGFVHRDIKPDNILFRQDGTAVLTDFGIARAVDSNSHLTRTGMFLGTLHYTSPEQAKGQKADARSDLYSLGIVFYEMLIGRVPYTGDEFLAVVMKHISGPLPKLPTHLSIYQPLLDKLLAKEPGQRFLSAKELTQRIDDLMSVAPPVKPGPSPEPTESLEIFMPSPSTEPIIAGIITVKGVSYEMVAIPGGEFQMGSDKGKDNERPVHRVELAAFQMGKTQVTQGLWQAVMGNNPSDFKKGDTYPVENVSWHDCQEFIQKLNQLTGGNYRLPTEAEWEYACRAGTTGDTYGKLDKIAWYIDNSGGSTHPVGLKQPNAFGLYDMLGNVWEWCQDWYKKNYYTNSPVNNPKGPDNGSYRVLRGGSFGDNAGLVRCAVRYGDAPGDRYWIFGFRLAAGSAKR